MLLKVSDGLSGWILLDQIEQVHLLAERKRVRSREELRSLEQGTDTLNLISVDCFKGGAPIEVGMIEFTRQGSTRIALFTSVAFICNDGGDTIERVNAGSSDQKRGRR
jgi:hypothetical protein